MEKKEKAIVIIPGITGSELFNNYEKVWIEVADLSSAVDFVKRFYNALKMDEHGNSVGNISVRDDKVSRYGALDSYKKIVDELQNAFGDCYDVRFFSYDWRKSTGDSAELLFEFIKNNGYSDVFFVCHSMGGLLASVYMSRYGFDRVSGYISLGTPYYGSPKALGAFITGEFLGTLFNIDMSKTAIDNVIIKDLVSNMPGVYELLPSKYYFKYSPYKNSYVYDFFDNPLSYEEIVTLMKTSRNEVGPLGLTGGQYWYKEEIFNSEEDIFEELNDFYSVLKSGEFNAHIIVGYNHLTRQYYYCSDNEYEKIVSVVYDYQGDGTVPLVSSTMGFSDEADIYYANGISHSGLVENDKVISLVKNIINDSVSISDSNSVISKGNFSFVKEKIISGTEIGRA